jgi:hypothetical protein
MDSGENVYCDYHCQADFDDIRFTAADGVTSYDYWREEYVEIGYAVFWVEVAANLDADQTIYIYYGSSVSSTTSSIENTFLYGDHFTSLPTNEGTANSNWNIRDGTWLYPTYGTDTGWIGPRTTVNLPSSQTSGIRVRGRFNVSNTDIDARGRVYVIMFDSLDEYQLMYAPATDAHDTNYGHWYSYDYHTDVVRWELGYRSSPWTQVGTWGCEVYENAGNDFFTHSWGSTVDSDDTDSDWTFDKIQFYTMRYSSFAPFDCAEIDWLFVAKYVAPEPGHGSWGSEEGSDTTHTDDSSLLMAAAGIAGIVIAFSAAFMIQSRMRREPEEHVYVIEEEPLHTAACWKCGANLDLTKVEEDRVYKCEFCGAMGKVAR